MWSGTYARKRTGSHMGRSPHKAERAPRLGCPLLSAPFRAVATVLEPDTQPDPELAQLRAGRVILERVGEVGLVLQVQLQHQDPGAGIQHPAPAGVVRVVLGRPELVVVDRAVERHGAGHAQLDAPRP